MPPGSGPPVLFVLAKRVSVAVLSGDSTGSKLGPLVLLNFPFLVSIDLPSLGRNQCYLLHISRSQAECCKLYTLYLVL